MADGNATTSTHTLKRFALIGFGVLVILFGLIYLIVAQSWSVVSSTESNANMQYVLSNLTNGAVVEQQLSKNGTQLSEVTLYPQHSAGCTGHHDRAGAGRRYRHRLRVFCP